MVLFCSIYLKYLFNIIRFSLIAQTKLKLGNVVLEIFSTHEIFPTHTYKSD